MGWFADTAGYGDSTGIEKEISNQVIVQQALIKCKSLRPILVIAYSELCAGRGKLFSDTIRIVVRIFKNF